MKPENNANKNHKRIVIWGAVILAITILGIAYWKYGTKEQETRDALYESGYTYPSEVGSKISSMDVRARIRCSKMGLTQEECPKSTGDTVRRLMATMMTQQAESHGPGPYSKGYAPEYAVAINHMFYQFIQSLEEFPCQPMLYRYASEKTLKALQEGEFIYQCGQGWNITAEWLEALEMERTDSIKPVGGVSMEQDVGLNCDGVLKNQLTFQRAASTAARMNVVISQIQNNQSECEAEVWNPTVVDLSTDVGNCYGNVGTAATSADETEASKKSKVGDANMPAGLLVRESSAYSSRTASGRDNENNIIVYFNLDVSKRPSDGASCWLYYSRLRQWHENFY